MDAFHVTYRLSVAEADAQARAEDLALEQTVEVPSSAIRDAFVAEQIRGRVEDVVADSEGGHLARIAYPVAATNCDPAQLVNVIFGNSSLHADTECIDVSFPRELCSTLQGPRFGISGLRKTIGVYDRPLSCTAIKPLGLSPGALADLLRTFARAGIDVIKDDHSLADQPFCRFEDRVRGCLAAAEEVAEETGRRATYVPNLIGTPATVFQQLRIAEDLGAPAVMVSPMVIGLPAFWELCHERSSLPVIAHPSFGGAQRIRPETLFGKIFRLYGADAVIFVSFATRFSPSREICRQLADRLRVSWGGLEPSLPIPAGGIDIESAAEVIEFYGPETMLLIGGSLQVDPDAIAERSRAFSETVRRHTPG